MSKIMLKNVRLSFESIFKKAMFDGKETKYEATFLIDKGDITLKENLDRVIEGLLSTNKIKVSKDKYCLKDGDESEYDGYEGTWSLKASQNKRPTVINRDKTPLVEEDNIIYSGCYVNAVIDFWIQDNSYGKRVNANLYGVQFVKDGEAFGAGPVDVTEEFDDIDDEL